MRLYIIRHAAPDYVNDTITKEGHKEAEALAKRFALHGFDKIYTSPMGRAIATMQYTTNILNMDYKIEDWTREQWPELVVENEMGEKVFAIDVAGELYRSDRESLKHDSWHQCKALQKSVVLDSYDKLVSDSDEFLLRHGYERVEGRYRCVKPNQDKIAVFCHAGFGLTWLAHLLEIPPTLMWSGFWIAPSSVTTILFEERSGDWAVPRCIGMGDTSHLYKEGLDIPKGGLKANIY
jgi:probable phosphoglycerate mutase